MWCGMDKVAVVILNWNGCEMLRSFLPSVVRCSDTEGTEIYVADNGSTDASVEMLRQEFPSVHLIILDKNRGFAEGYNLALQQVSAEYVVLLNSDVEVIGSLRFSDDLLIDGTVEGDISSEGVLSVGQNAVIRAEINTKSVIIHGKVIGNVTVTDRVELKSTAELVGDIQAASLAIEGGAIFIGHSTVGAPTVGTTGASAAKKAASVHAFAPEPETHAPASQSTLDIDAE